ncbi:MAG: type I methionyl aminopeptidase [Dissulfurimicrobium sp.]|uniref:type I methionyl aminopeptidase n=1 Tax=Dissulfurimicrobium sp. TaxID=2022436 RepID=UPI00404B9E3F
MRNYKSAKTIILKSPWEIDKLRIANRIVANILNEFLTIVKAGSSTYDLDKIAEEKIKFYGAAPAFKGYHGYPATTCISINNEVVHGIPSKKRILKEGDLVSIDLGVVYDGYYGDSAISLIVGSDIQGAKKLIDVTRGALLAGIKEARSGVHLGNISSAIQKYVEDAGFNVVRKFVGHGIGRALHEPPEVPNYGARGSGPILKEGMVLAIEPMVNAGGPDVRILEDGWTVVTVDNSLSAHFEHTIAITAKGQEILSQPY